MPPQGRPKIGTPCRALHGAAAVVVGWFACFSAFAADVGLAWDPSSDPSVVGYNVYYGVASRQYAVKLDVGAATVFTVRNLSSGQTYYFAVTARNAASEESTYSNETSASIRATAGAPIMTLASSANPSVTDASVTFTASVTGIAPTGSVAFQDGATTMAGCASVALSGSGNTRTATCTSTSLGAGTHDIVANYSGDPYNLAAASAALLQTVQPAPMPTFADVPATHWAFGAIEVVARSAITQGCATEPRRYCPDATLTRAEMAVFLERVIHGPSFAYSPVGTVFADVPLSHWAAGPIEQLRADGVTSGCAVGPLRYCPDRPISRAEMAVLLLRAKYGPGYDPGSATGFVFVDVPATSWAAAWIERFQALGFTNGCGAGHYCPDAYVRRDEMAAFLARVFALAGPPS